MTTPAEDLAKARARLVETLSGRKPLKLNAAPTLSNGYEEFAAQIKLNAAQQQKLNSAKKELVETLSHGSIHGGFDDGIKVMEIPADLIARQAAARAELHERLAGRYRKPQKQNQCPRDNSTGAKNTTLDSPNTPFGMPFTGGWEITARNGQITLDSILADAADKADEDSPSPAVTSGRDGTADWSPRDHQDTEYNGGDDEDADPVEESESILSMYSTPDGTIRKHAAKHFLTVSGSGTSKSDFSVPLSRMNKLSMQPEYFDKFLDEAFMIAAGRDSVLANYGKMSRVIRIKQRNKMPLNEAQQDHRIRHMAAVEPTVEEYNTSATGRTQ